MALRALRIDVLAEQRERGEAMIKPHAISPGHVVMTAFATLALFLPVYVIITMTVYAGGLQRNIEDRLDVAITA